MNEGGTLNKVVFSTWRGYLLGLGLVGLTTLVSLIVHTDVTNITMAYLLSIVITSALAGMGPSILASVLSVGIIDFASIPPFMSFGPPSTEHIFILVVFFLVGLITSSLTSQIRRQTQTAKQNERQMAVLYSLSRTLADSIGHDDIIRVILGGAKRILGDEVAILLPDSQDIGKFKAYTKNPAITVSENKIEAASRLLQDGHAAEGAAVAPNGKTRYFHLVSAGKTVGILVMSAATHLTTDKERLLEAFADLAAVSIERTQLAEKAHNVEIMKVTEKLQTALLSSISHDLRTPLVSIIGVLSSLQEQGIDLDDAARMNLIQVAREEAERLNHLVTNLLNMSRIEAGAIRISRQPSDVCDLVDVALQQLARESNKRPIQIDIPAQLPFVAGDFGLMVQMLVNILDNAFKYSPPDSPIDINGRQVGNEIQIEVADRGVGIAKQDLVRVFDKFYRVQNTDNVVGTGLGLSICKGIVEAHGGRVAAENRPGGGTLIRLTLPVGEV